MNITVKIDAQEIAQAINALAQAINNNPSNSFKALEDAQQQVPAQPVPTQQQPVQQPVQQQQVPTQQPVQQQVPTQQPAPAQQQQAPTQQQVPTAQQTYTLDELGKAAALLMDAGKQQDLVNLLGQFGVQALTQLPKEQYGAFATALRGLGAQI